MKLKFHTAVRELNFNISITGIYWILDNITYFYHTSSMERELLKTSLTPIFIERHHTVQALKPEQESLTFQHPFIKYHL